MKNLNIKNDVKRNNSLFAAMNDLVSSIPLDDVKATYNTKTGTASVTGHRNGIQYMTTLSGEADGIIKTDSMFNKNMGRNALSDQIKKLSKDGYKQGEIANMLGVSQPTVSNYLRRGVIDKKK